MTHRAKEYLGKIGTLRNKNYVNLRPPPQLAIWGALSVLLTAFPTDAQEPLPSQRISVSYFGESFSNPGARLGYEGSLWQTGPLEFVVVGSLGMFVEPSARRGFFGLVETGGRLLTGSGLLFDLRLGAGYLNIAWDESVSRPQPALSTSHFMPSVMLGLGYDLRPKAGLPVGILVRSGMIGRYSSDDFFDGAYVLDAGLFFSLK